MTLSLSDSAARILSERLRGSLLPQGSGLRIWGSRDTGDDVSLSCGFVEGPTLADEIVEDAEVRIFLDRDISEELADKTITVAQDAGRLTLIVIDDWFAEGDWQIP